MGTINRFEDLEIWKTARLLAKQIYRLADIEPFSKDFRFRDQIRAAAGSVMDNIAEGFERSSRLEFLNFLGFSKGSTGEVRSQLYRAIDLKYIDESVGKQLIEEYQFLASKISRFIKYLNATIYKGQKSKDRLI